MSDVWTPGNVQVLRTLWADGLSARQVVAQFHKLGVAVSRSAVLSKVHRLGIASRPEPARPSSRSLRAPRSPKPDRRLTKPSQKAHPTGGTPKAHREIGALRSASNVAFTDAEPWQCQMFVGQESGALGLVCGGRVEKGRWCAACAKLAYEPLRRSA